MCSTRTPSMAATSSTVSPPSGASPGGRSRPRCGPFIDPSPASSSPYRRVRVPAGAPWADRRTHGSRMRSWGMDSSLLTIDTTGRTVLDLTGEVERFCASHGDGLVHVFAPHATAGLALMEVGSGSEWDLGQALQRLLPRDDRYQHRHGAEGHGADHLLPALVCPSLSIPVLA